MDRVDKKHFYCYTIDGSNDGKLVCFWDLLIGDELF